jgi:hypothetical protein
LNNLTMMHHPMHVISLEWSMKIYSPLKHTVNVPPMGNVTIEFYGSEYRWFCPLYYTIWWEVWQESLVMTLKGYAYERVSCFWVSSWNKQILFLGNGGCSISFYGLTAS